MYIFSSVFSVALSIIILSFFNYKDKIYNNSGIVSITGSRCFLALAVMISHSTHYLYSIKHDWIFNADFKLWFGFDNYFVTLGKVGVLIFFMISGFLFYRIIYKDNFYSKSLIINRFKRLLPAYWSSMLLILIIGQFYFNPKINLEYVFGVLRWAIFIGTYQIGDLNTSYINSGIDWTLKIEWLLYLSIIPISYLTKGMSYRKKDFFIFISVFIILCIAAFIRKYGHIYTDPRPVLGFISGLIAFRFRDHLKDFRLSKLASVLTIFFLVIGLFSCAYAGYYLIMLASCTVIFLIISSGNDIFGLLSNKTIVSLGEVSFSIYLFHGIVIFFISRALGEYSKIYSENLIYCVIFNTIIIITSALIAKVSYLKVEKRFYN